MKHGIKLLSVKTLSRGKKKYEAKFEIDKLNGKKRIKTIKFGAKNYAQYPIHRDIDRRNRYINRHIKDLRTNDPMRAGYLSMYILWNKKTLKASIADYKRRLKIYNKTGKFPKNIPNSPLKNNFGNDTNISLYNRLINFGVKVTFDEIPKIKIYDVDKITKKISTNSGKSIKKIKKSIVTKAYNENLQKVTSEFNNFIGDLYSKNIKDEDFQFCLIELFRYCFKYSKFMNFDIMNKILNSNKLKFRLLNSDTSRFLFYLTMNDDGIQLLKKEDGVKK